MANDSLQNLADALKAAAAKGPVTLNAAFVQDAGVTPPDGFDAMLRSAFRLDANAAGLEVTFAPSSVGAVSGDAFQVTSAQLTAGFLGATAAQTTVVMTFTLPDTVLQVQIQAELTGGWTFSTFFTYMTGWPFNILVMANPTFVFSTVEKSYTWRNTTIALKTGQNFTSMLAVPSQFQPIFKLVQGLGVVKSPLPFFGPITIDKADNETILYPDLNLSAKISDEQIQIYFLKAYAPSIGFQIETVMDVVDEDGEGEPEPVQTPGLFFGAKIDVTLDVPAEPLTDAQSTLTLDIQALLMQSGRNYAFTIMVDPLSDVRLTPMTVANVLMDGNSYFRYVPPQLQAFLTTVGLEGLSLAGPLLPSAGVSSVGVDLGSAAGQPIVLIGDPTNGAVFTIESIMLNWVILNPLNTASRRNLVNFSTTFTLFPTVFRQPDGSPGGTFEVSIDQDFNIDAAFAGSVSMDDLLPAVTMGQIGMPEGVSVTFSDVVLSLSPSAKSYSFAFTFDASLDFVTWDGEPLLQFQGMRFTLAASTPTGTKGGTGVGATNGTTVYKGSIAGVIGVGPILVNTFVEYDGTRTPGVWTLRTSLAQPLNLSDLVDQFFKGITGGYDFPSFLPGTLTVESFSVDATIPTKTASTGGTPPPGNPAPPATTQQQSTYKVAGKVAWEYDGLPGLPIKTIAEIGLEYDGNQPVGKQFSGSVIGTIMVTWQYGSTTVNLELMIGYRFGPASQDAKDLGPGSVDPLGTSKVLWVQWQGIRTTYDITNQTISLSLKGWTVGSLLQALVRLIGDPYFTLESPWDVLNQIPLDGLSLVYDLKPNVANRVTAKYTLPAPINFGFMKITGLKFQLVDGKVTIAIDGTTSVPGLQSSPLFNPSGSGQNVQQMPQVPGQGNQLFDLRLLALGQRIGIVGSPTFDSTKAVITALKDVPSTSGTTNPVDPNSTQKGQPYYNPDNNWLVAADFGLLKVGPVYTFDCMIVFNDPNLYGLRLQFNGEKAKVLAGLAIDILYKKITDDIGLYQIDFSFPSILRNLDFGAFSIVLPNIGIQIYTNGDFFFDFGFPYNLNFARSFTVQAIVYGVPVLGSAGFYFGKLSNATAKGLPQTTKGTFDPVIVFGLGVQIGVGRYFEKGPLKAGFSITVFGIIEGTLAAWHPYDATGLPADTSAVQGNYYFKLQGSFGVIGKLYGTVDFAVIKADVELLVQIVAKVTYESFRAIPLSLSAHVSVKVSVKINLGLFSISISFSFATTISADLTIGSNSRAPWDDGASTVLAMRRMARIAPVPAPAGLLRSRRALRFRPLPRLAAEALPELTLVPAPQFTVMIPDIASTDLAAQQGAFVFLLAMDAPTAGGSGNQEGSSFESLCRELLPWVIDSFAGKEGATRASLDETSVTKVELQAIVDALADNENPPISYADIIDFLKATFTVNVVPVKEGADPAVSESIKNGATIFPPFPGFWLKVPPSTGTDDVTIQLWNYVTITDAYRAEIAEIFQQLAARVEDEPGQSPAQAKMMEAVPEPLSQFVFEDYFLLIARQIVQYAADALDDYSYPLASGDSLLSILTWAQQRGNEYLTVQDVATPNLAHPLTAARRLSLQGLVYTVQSQVKDGAPASDSLTAIATRYSDPAAGDKRWETTQSGLILANAALSTLVATNVTLTMTVEGKEKIYTTQPGDSFQSIADATGQTIEQLAAQTGLYDMTNLLVAPVAMAIPPIAYTTAAGDTLDSITTAFAMALDQLIDVQENQVVPDFFDAAAEANVRIAYLDALYVSDLWAAIIRDDQVAQVAGMAARYPLHGVRLPNTTGLGLPSGFLYPAGQPDYGLYQLTGQQFPTPDLSAGGAYGITLGKDTVLDWVQFDGSTGTGELALDLTKQAGDLSVVLAYARATGYDPAPTLEIQPDVSVAPKRTAVQSSSLWSTSDLARLATITAPPALMQSAADEASSGAQVQPVLWLMPDSVLREAEQRQVALATRFSIAGSLPYLPVLMPQAGTTDPATQATTYADMENYAFATRIDFQVKVLAQADDLTPQNPFANDVVPPDSGNAGSQAQPLAPYNYELIGPGPSDAVLLQRLLTAMDELGQDIISDIFILYPDNGAAPTGLVSRAPAEFLSFITQTNLSTETNPPQAMRLMAATAGAQPRGIADTPGEFIKLMWELSTVRSGGYYLYYEMVGQEAGLPVDLFDDSGVATLTLVITYDRSREPQNGGYLTNYVNAFVTTDPIDMNRTAMSMESRSAQAETAALSGTETLQSLADLYGADVGTLARLNSGRGMASGVQIPISGAVRQVTPDDLATGNVLQSFAAYYSKGAKTPITEADITAFNPGVPVALYSVFRIPPIVYVVSADAGGPGTTFDSLAAYYALPVEALADLVRNVAGTFAKGATLATDSIDLDAQPALGLGNIGLALTRADLGTPPDLPPDPTQAEKDAFAKAYLYSLYQLLTAGLYGNAFFTASGPGLSFGPRKPLSQEDAAALRRPRARRMLMASEEEEATFDYSQALGFGLFSTVNPAPDVTPTDLPPQSANPYVGVGTFGQFDLAWVDIFGNRTVTPFSAPPSGYKGPLNDPPAMIDYVDRLIGLDKWPNVRTYYTYAGTEGNPELQMVMTLNTAAYEPTGDDNLPCKNPPEGDIPQWQQSALNDLQAFTRLYFQLNQNYDTLDPKIPGLSGNAVSMWLHNSILEEPDAELSDADVVAVRDFVAACTAYVYNRASCTAGGDTPSLTLSIPVPLSSVAVENIIKLDVAFMMRRQADLSDPALRVIEDGLEVATVIRPYMDLPDETDTTSSVGDGATPPPQNIGVFAAALERVFIDSAWQLRVGTGASDPDQPRTSETFSVWAVRMGRQPGVGLTYTVGSELSYYAPMPVANELRTDTVVLNGYTTGRPYPDGQTPPVTFTGVDMNVWANTALTAIDTFLTPTFASPAYILDNLLFADPENEGYVAKILEHKEKLAGAIASTVRPILVTSATDAETQAAAREKMYQALLNRLSNAYLVTAVTVVPVTNASTNEPDAPGTAASPRFFGQPQAKETTATLSVTDSSEQNFSLSSGKIPLRPAGEGGDSRLAFLFSSKNVQQQSYVALDLSYALTHLETNIRKVPGIDGYEQSSWITFVNGPFMSEIASDANIPVVLRALPTPPTVTTQSATAADADASGSPTAPAQAAPADLAKWSYGFDYVYLGSAQDSVRTTVEFNLAPASLRAMMDAGADLFQALAQFMTVYPAVASDMQTYLRTINASSTVEDTEDAADAVDAFNQIVQGVADAYVAWADAQGAMMAMAELEHVRFVFDIVLANDGNQARIDIFPVSLEPEGTVLPNPVVLIDPDVYQWESVTPPEGALASYRYKLKEPPPGQEDAYLSYEGALAMPERGVMMDELNLFAFQNAWSAIQVWRNQFLVPGVETTDTFRFSTPTVQFVDPIVPLLQYAEYDLGSLLPGTAPLSDYLDAFFESLLGGAVGQQVQVSMGSSFSYVLVPSMSTLPYTTLPINLLPPTPATVETGKPPSFVAPFSAAVTTWLTTVAPVLNSTSTVDIELAVFAGITGDTAQQLPLLKVRDLYIDANIVETGAG